MTLRALRNTALPAFVLAMGLAACDAKADHAASTSLDGRWEFDMVFTGDAMCAFEGLPLVVMIRQGHAGGLYSEPNYGGWTYTARADDTGDFLLTLGGYAIIRLVGTLSGDSGRGDIEVSGTSMSCGGDWTARKLPQAT